MLERFALLIITAILEWLEKRVTRGVTKIIEEKKQDKVHEENAKDYELASDRKEKIKRALDLLNGVRSQ